MISKPTFPSSQYGWLLCIGVWLFGGCSDGVNVQKVLKNSIHPIPQTSASPVHYSVVFDSKLNDYLCISYTQEQTLPLDLKLDSKTHRFFQSKDALIAFNNSTKVVMIFHKNNLQKKIKISEKINPWHLTWTDGSLISQEVRRRGESGYHLFMEQYDGEGSLINTGTVAFESKKKTGMYRVLLSFLMGSHLYTFIPITEELIVFDKSLKIIERRQVKLPENVRLLEGTLEKHIKDLEENGHLEVLNRDFNGIRIKVIPTKAFVINNTIKLSFLTVSAHGYDYSESRVRLQTKTDLIWLDSQLEITNIEEISQWHILGLHGEDYLGRKENPVTPQRPIFSLITPAVLHGQNP